MNERPKWWNSDQGYLLDPNKLPMPSLASPKMNYGVSMHFNFARAETFSIRIFNLQYPFCESFSPCSEILKTTFCYSSQIDWTISIIDILMWVNSVMAHRISGTYTAAFTGRSFRARGWFSCSFVGWKVGRLGISMNLRASQSWSRTCHIWAPAPLSTWWFPPEGSSLGRASVRHAAPGHWLPPPWAPSQAPSAWEQDLPVLTEMSPHSWPKAGDAPPSEVQDTSARGRAFQKWPGWSEDKRALPCGLDDIRSLNFCVTLSQGVWRVPTKHVGIEFPTHMTAMPQSR